MNLTLNTAVLSASQASITAPSTVLNCHEAYSGSFDCPR